MKLRVLDIVGGTSVDGPGLRTSIYFAGCTHHCKGCHNPQSWEPAGGMPMSIDDIVAVVDENDFDVTFSGGDPLMQPGPMTELAKRLKADGRNIWCYTGYSYEEVAVNPLYSELLSYIDVSCRLVPTVGLALPALRWRRVIPLFSGYVCYVFVYAVGHVVVLSEFLRYVVV